jgi:hypothetical protein
MFRNNTASVAEPLHDEVISTVDEEPVPLSHLGLDLDVPAIGWVAYLTGRGVSVLVDDLGRDSISRVDAKQLLDERRQAEIRRREVAERQEQQAIEADRQWREHLNPGLPWYEIPPGVSAAELWAAAEKDAKPKRRTPLEDALASEGMVYRQLQDEEAS